MKKTLVFSDRRHSSQSSLPAAAKRNKRPGFIVNRLSLLIATLCLLVGLGVGFGAGFALGWTEMKALHDVNVEAMRLRDKQLEHLGKKQPQRNDPPMF